MNKVITTKFLSKLQYEMWPLSKRNLTVIEDESGITINIRFGNLAYKSVVSIFEIQNAKSVEALKHLIEHTVIEGRDKILIAASSECKINITGP